MIRRIEVVPTVILVALLVVLPAHGQELRTLMGHTGPVYSVVFSPDGKTLASGSGDGTVRLWDVATGAPVRSLPCNARYVTSVAFSPDGAKVAAGSYDTTIKLWDVELGTRLRVLTGDYSDNTVAFSPDGKTIACGAWDTIRLWDVTTGQLLRTLRHVRGDRSIAFSPDGRLLASANGFYIELREVATGERAGLFRAHTDSINTVVFSPDGKTLSSGSDDHTIKLWDVAASKWDGKEIRSMSGHTSPVMAVAFSPDGKLIASGSGDGASGAGDSTVRLWDAASGKQMGLLSQHTGTVRSVAFSPDGRILASGSDDMTIRLWDVAVAAHPNQPPEGSFVWQALSSSGARLVVAPRTGDRLSFDASGSSDPDGKITSYEWDWESDGTYELKSGTATTEHTYANSGAHRVTLRVTDDKGATATVTQTINIGANQPPQAAFSVTPTKPSILDAVRFTDASTNADGQVKSWSWEFGDGATSTERSPTHTYARKGTFGVKLTVTDNDGLTGTKTVQLTVANLPPEASFAFEPQAPVLGQTARFDASGSSDRDGTIEAYAWDFDGDGKTDASGATATYSFTSAGARTVTLVVTDSDGATAERQETLTVAAVPPGPPRFVRQWGLVIGVADYEDPAIPDLQYTEADAQAFYDFLTDPRGGGFVKDNVRLLLNGQGTSSAVKGGFSWLIQQAKKDDLVVIYFAGHGGTAPDLDQPPDEADGVDEYLVTYDAKYGDLFSTAVRDDEVGNWLAAFRSDHVVVILDSCFAGGATRSLAQEGTRAGPGNQVFSDMVGDGRLFLAASQESEVSYEDPALGHGVFTYYLLRGLGALGDPKTLEADADKDGRVTVEELETYLAREVSKERNQHPLVTGDLTLARVALSGYGEPLVGAVTAIDGDRVSISLGSRQGVQVGDRFEVVHELLLPDGTTMTEVRAIIEVLYVLGPDRAACRIIELFYPIGARDSVRVPRSAG